MALWQVQSVAFFATFCMLTYHIVAQNADELLEEHFDVKPGGQVITVQQKMDSFSCIFTYAAQGGTHEEWVMTISGSPDKSSYSCTVERPGGRSYLFFQQFKLKIKGAKLEEAAAFGDADTPLRPEEYSIVKNTVKYNEEKFRSQLTKIMVFGLTSKKTEL